MRGLRGKSPRPTDLRPLTTHLRSTPDNQLQPTGQKQPAAE